MREVGIGHNSKEFEACYRLRVRQWQKAKAAMAGPRLSVAQVKRRMARAEELGLSFAQYQSLRLATGRDPRAFLFTPEGMGLRLARRIVVPEAARAKLARLRHCHLMALAPACEAPGDFLEELRAESRLPFAAAVAMPGAGAGWGAIRAAFAPVLSPLSLPGDAVIVIGADGRAEAGLAAAINAGFLPGADYFRAPFPDGRGGNAA